MIRQHMLNAIILAAAAVAIGACSPGRDAPGPDRPSPPAVEPAPEEPTVDTWTPVEPPPGNASDEPEFVGVTDGIGLFDGSLRIAERRVRFHVASVDLSRHQAALLVDSQPKSPGVSIARFLDRSGGSVALSGGFLKSFYPALPLGYVQSAGEPVNRSHTTDLLNGLLLLGPGADIRSTDFVPGKYEALAERWRDVLQSGPLLVLDGRSRLSEDLAAPNNDADRRVVTVQAIRAFVAVECNERMLLGLTGDMTLRELAEVLSRSAADGGFACRAALNLSGAESAGLLVDAGGRRAAFGGTDYRLANAIVVR